MPQVPQLPAVTGGVYPSSSVGALVTAVAFLKKPPQADLKQTAAQSIPTGVFTAIQFNVGVIDTDYLGGSGHNNVTNNSRYTANYAGNYWVGAGVGFAASNGGAVRIGTYFVNGVAVDAADAVLFGPSASVAARVALRGKLIALNVNDYIEVAGFQDTAGALNTSVGSTDRSHFSIVRVSD